LTLIFKIWFLGHKSGAPACSAKPSAGSFEVATIQIPIKNLDHLTKKIKKKLFFISLTYSYLYNSLINITMKQLEEKLEAYLELDFSKEMILESLKEFIEHKKKLSESQKAIRPSTCKS